MLGKAVLMSGGIPSRPGTQYAGGFYVGRMKINGVRYALIVAPKAAGEAVNTPITSGNRSADILSDWDGAANTAAMVANPVQEAAAFCKNLTIGGFTDWVLPARDQLELCYRNLKPGTTANDTGAGYGSNPNADPPTPDYTSASPAQTISTAFRVGGSEAFASTEYWSSTGYTSTTAITKSFDSGTPIQRNRGLLFYVRAVRMITI